MVNGKCQINTGPSGKIRDGECTFFVWELIESASVRSDAAQGFAYYTSALALAAQQGAAPKAERFNFLTSKIAPSTAAEIETLALHAALLILGRRDIAAEHAHRPGYVDLSHLQTPLQQGGFLSQLQLGTPPAATLAMFELAVSAVTEFLRTPDLPQFRKAMAQARNKVPAFTGHGNCQYPHPSRNHHAFEFDDAYDCVTRELLHVLTPIAEPGIRNQS